MEAHPDSEIGLVLGKWIMACACRCPCVHVCVEITHLSTVYMAGTTFILASYVRWHFDEPHFVCRN